MSTRTRAAGILTAITMTAVLAACSPGSDSSSGGDAVDASSGEMSDGGGDAEAGAPSEREAESATGSDSGSTSSYAAQAERSVIATGAISLASKDVAATRREVQRIVDAQGGAITEESTDTDDAGATTYARLVIRVPSTKFGAAMVALEQAAVLRSSNRGSDDVTTEVIDTGVRVRAQEASLKRVELLLAEAETLKDIIWIESQLTNRQAELDSLKSQQSWLADQTSQSTITLDISSHLPVQTEEPDDEEPAGFLAGLRGGMGALGVTLSAVATVVGALLPFATLLLVLGLPVWLVLRRRRGTQPQPVARADA